MRSPDAEVLEQIADLAHRELQWEGTLQPEQRLVEDLGLDSLRLLTLAVAVENHFEVCLDPQDEAELITVGDLVRVVGEKGAGR
jgi:acyl carrier protein